ncbi:histidinol-phosphate transaminase [Lacrimispora celerecrescens]|uniref:Histidinol-phosphate aminotransferase n=1 Tax=[Clostridium] celerecrescens 18A TaxID=1286362 RepID=A0A2M8Z6I4_9FIRM|nr:histidinol-phosphate transaminase [Lacrimispora celerecrescens]PJJ29055.1 histidinol-phosphate aminotransferase [[Clostridium] celerecrescens 18A]
MKPWEANIRRIAPYVPGEQPKGEKLIKLNTNENPYPPSPGVKQALAQMDCDLLRKYPDPAATVLIKALSNAYEIEEDRIFVGVGSDDVIAVAFMTFFNSGKPLLFPDVSYSFYKVWADLFRIPYETPALDEEFCIQKEDYYRENGGIIFPNPNAPTGLLMPLSEVEDIIAHNQESVVIVDEAYIDFGGESAIKLIEKYENLLVVQTFSKSHSMAGMRIGCAYGHPDLIRALNDVKYSFNSYTMNIPSLVLGAKALEDDKYFKETLDKIIYTREQAKKRLGELGFTFPDSMANFIFASHKERRAEEIYKALRENDIYVRYFNQPRLDNHLRISIGTEEEMEALYAFLKEFL